MNHIPPALSCAISISENQKTDLPELVVAIARHDDQALSQNGLDLVRNISVGLSSTLLLLSDAISATGKQEAIASDTDISETLSLLSGVADLCAIAIPVIENARSNQEA